MTEKVYYWIKLRMDFFKSPAVKLLRRMSGGDTYALIYLEMILLSLENKGFIYFAGIGKDMADEVALILDEKKIDVEFLLTFLSAKKLIEYSDPNAFKFSDDVTEGLIGKEVSSAKRVRAWRKRQKALQSNSDVTTSNTELDIEIDKEKDIDIEAAAKELPQLSKYTKYFSAIDQFCQKNFGFVAPIWQEALQDDFKDWLKLNDDPKQVTNIICLALKEASGNNNVSNKVKYAESILDRWEKSNLTTVNEIKADQKEYQQKQEQRKAGYNQRKTIQKEQVPDWNEATKNQKQYTPDEQKALQAKLADLSKRKEVET